MAFLKNDPSGFQSRPKGLLAFAHGDRLRPSRREIASIETVFLLHLPQRNSLAFAKKTSSSRETDMLFAEHSCQSSISRMKGIASMRSRQMSAHRARTTRIPSRASLCDATREIIGQGLRGRYELPQEVPSELRRLLSSLICAAAGRGSRAVLPRSYSSTTSRVELQQRSNSPTTRCAELQPISSSTSKKIRSSNRMHL